MQFSHKEELHLSPDDSNSLVNVFSTPVTLSGSLEEQARTAVSLSRNLGVSCRLVMHTEKPGKLVGNPSDVAWKVLLRDQIQSLIGSKFSVRYDYYSVEITRVPRD